MTFLMNITYNFVFFPPKKVYHKKIKRTSEKNIQKTVSVIVWFVENLDIH